MKRAAIAFVCGLALALGMLLGVCLVLWNLPRWTLTAMREIWKSV